MQEACSWEVAKWPIPRRISRPPLPRKASIVTLIEEDAGEKKVWQIVGEPEADVKKGKISVTSPIARALIGKRNGATVEVEAPGGTKVYKIHQVRWPKVR
jgi:transcription elongation GreA/GreB family factor